MKQTFYIFLFTIYVTSLMAQNVGIGINTGMSARLHVAKADSAIAVFQNTTAYTDSLKSRIYFKTGSAFTGAVGTHIEQVDVNNFAYGRLGLFTFADENANNLVERLSITDDGSVGIGTVKPTALLDINGALRIRGGNPGAGKVLTSDANGKASWKGSGMNSAFRASFPSTMLANANTSILPYNTSGINNFDDGGNWSNTNNRYTATETGIYHFDAIVEFGSAFQTTSAGAAIYLQMFKNNSPTSEASTKYSTSAGSAFDLTVNLSWTVRLDAGEFLNFQIYQISGQARPATGILSGYRIY